MKMISYIVARDFGFAPNPFYNFCTLATCKPKIRKFANVNDWVIGTGAKRYNLSDKLIFAMKVNEKLTFNEYWSNPKFLQKKPTMHGSLKQMYGDNIYYYDDIMMNWVQIDSHHSNEDGSINQRNLLRDTSANFVLISEEFYYFGKEAINIPDNIVKEVCMKGQGSKYLSNDVSDLFLNWLKKNYTFGIHADPWFFNFNFERYKG